VKPLRALLIVVLLFTVSGCGQRRQVQTYVGAVSKEVPTIQNVGRDTGQIFKDLQSQGRAKDLLELAARLEVAAEDMTEQVEKLKKSKQSAAAVPAPKEAKELEARLMDCYDQWIGLGEDMSKVCDEAAESCREIAGASGKDKLTELRSAGKELKVRLESLKKQADTARESSEKVSEELGRLNKKFGKTKKS
jgi:predicted  nucleic acid-binding Zn-ribbon protein